MKSKFKNLLIAGALVASTAVITTEVVSQDTSPEMEAMMEAWAELARPGPQHEKLAQAAGNWNSVIKHWMMPGSDAVVSETRAAIRPIMDGRFTVQHVTGRMDMGMGMQDFEGIGIYGYDKGMQKYVYSWVDNFGTMIMNGVGEEDADGNIVYWTEFPDPSTGGMLKMKSVMRYISDNENVYDMYMDAGGGQMFKVMEIASHRADGHDHDHDDHDHDHDDHDHDHDDHDHDHDHDG